jgi:CRP-like cAMP-binding protein
MTVVALTPCKLVEIDRDQFNELLAANLTAPYKLLKNIAIILAERLHKLTMIHQRHVEAESGGSQESRNHA